MVILNVELVVQGVGGAPAPACTYLIGSLVGGAHVTLVVDLVNRQIGAPCPTALVVVDLSTIGKTLDRLDLYETSCVQTETDALVVGTLAVYEAEDRVAGIRGVVEHTHVLQIFVAELATIAVINGNQWVGTQSGRQYVRVLVANLDTLILLVAVV